ncbi:hypothetical protein HYH02_000050 [Chlamydomonas schloesseri]|uniref:Ion transport domain-containing protein n=1 Tax=Chlamydomonas schloesseri TaxID=2026947 RepID=A0A836B7F5_9CHLO|nr:hypothetical protein HYH02_000050 [Chlamydomonas schloesseri]|eukprot:KAG2449946.1 hypothetical protein HYH02_000050 [Chlamydomonas schloesseri]
MVKVAPEASGLSASVSRAKGGRSSRVFRAVNDVYEFDGWLKIWLAVVWFAAAGLAVTYHYPPETGMMHSTMKRLMTSYEPAPGANMADVQTAKTFQAGVAHALGFLKAYINKANLEGEPEGRIPVTEYDKIMFARITVDYKTNCKRQLQDKGMMCYTNGTDPLSGAKLSQERLAELVDTEGGKKTTLFDKGDTRAKVLARIDQIENDDLTFISTYSFTTKVEFGTYNELSSYYRSAYIFTISRKNGESIGSQALREVSVAIDCVDVRNLPLYIAADDYTRIIIELVSFAFLLKTFWDEFVQLQVVRAWRGLYLTPEELADQKKARRRGLHVLWFFISQPWNFIDFLTLVNYTAWWVVYAIHVLKSYSTDIKEMDDVSDYIERRDYADARLQHMVWGIFSAVLIGLRILPQLKTHGGLRVYSATLKLSWHRLKDLIVFFGYVGFLVTTLASPLFELTGANTLFKDTGTGLLNVALLTFQYMGYTEYFAAEAPTFGEYRLIFMFIFWAVVFILAIISQNVLLALVASAYEEAREAEGAVERTHFTLSFYRIWWMFYARWHRWIRRKSRYQLLRELMAACRRPDVTFYQHVFVRWAVSDLPEARLLTMLYSDPASEVLYMYSPWAWYRVSPEDEAQMAPWDEQLDYPMYCWADVPVDKRPGAKPRLLRPPPLYTAGGGATGRAAARARMPINYSDADPVFAMTEAEVNDLIDSVEDCWGRMQRYRVVVKYADVGWSEEGRELLREGLLEVYRRHLVPECTTSTVKTSASISSAGSVKSAALLDELGASNPSGTGKGRSSNSSVSNAKALVSLPEGGEAAPNPASATIEESLEASAAEAAFRRNRQFSMFNRRGRIADNLDLLWGEVQSLRLQQLEIKSLLEAIVAAQQPGQQQQQQQQGGGGGGGGGGHMLQLPLSEMRSGGSATSASAAAAAAARHMSPPASKQLQQQAGAGSFRTPPGLPGASNGNGGGDGGSPRHPDHYGNAGDEDNTIKAVGLLDE